LNGKCSLFPKIENHDEYLNKKKISDFLIRGIQIKNEEKKDYYFCSTARSFNDMCGTNGERYKDKNIIIY
jgi:hypothetical protein